MNRCTECGRPSSDEEYCSNACEQAHYRRLRAGARHFARKRAIEDARRFKGLLDQPAQPATDLKTT